MKSSKRSNKNINLKLNKTLNLTNPKITKWSLYLLGAVAWFPWPFGDGLMSNHNEMFLADVS